MYQDMFDKQLSLALSSRGVGFANMLEANIDRQNPNQVADHQPASLALSYQSNEPKLQPLSKNTVIAMSTDDQQHRASPELSPHDSSEKLAEKSLFSSPKEFVTSLWDNAKHAASIIGVNPAVLMAQAALETDWGRKVIPHASGNSSHNLFNIKADPTWHQTSTTASTLEQKDGVLTKEKANFRCYQSFKESFQDYASMIKFSSRYKKAVENAHEPAAYTHALQEAGYASDKNYANKIIGIMKSPLFQSLISNLK
jgi:flagellar protein FlgJ